MKKDLIWPGTIILAAIIIGGSLLMVQSNKQASIERQAQAKIEREREIERKAEEEKAEEERKASLNKTLLNICLDGAREEAWEYIKLNGTKVAGKEDVYNAPQYIWNEHDAKKKTAEDLCFKKY
jgi:hypothetical protein